MQIKRILIKIFGSAGLLVLLLAMFIEVRYGGGTADFPDRTTTPLYPGGILETVADLPLPPGNLAISEDGRLFFSFHPEARPHIRVAEWKNGQAVPYPSEAYQGSGSQDVFFDTVLSVRIDGQNRLWTLDLANHGLGQPRLLAFDLATDQLVHRFDFPDEYAGLGSHLNDFQVDPEGKTLYIADASILAKTPAILVYDVDAQKCRRLLESDPSVLPEPYVPVVGGRKMEIFGIFAIRPGVDSIALDKDGKWLYFAPVTATHMYRIRTTDLKNPDLSSQELSARVEEFAPKSMSDGLSMDAQNNIYITDMEHFAILRLTPDKGLQTLIIDDRLRWPDGLGFGPDGYLYVSCSALHQVIGRTPGFIKNHSPYQIFRFTPGVDGIPGH